MDAFERRPALIALGLTALLWWPLIFSDRFTYVHSPDLTGQVLPWYQVQAESWRAGEFPTWDPYVWGGQPLIGQAQPGAVFPLNWPLFLAPLGEDGHIRVRLIDLHFGLMHLLAAWFAFLLARELGRGRFASVAAGVAFACAGFVGSIGWPQMLNGAVWLPLTLLFFHRAWGRRSMAWAILCGGSIGVSLLSGHHQTPYFALLAVAALGAAELWRARGEGGGRRGLALVGFALAAAFLVGAMQILPALEYGAEAYRWVDLPEPVAPGGEVPYIVHSQNRFFPITLIGLVVSSLSFQVKAFVGWVVLLAAIYGVATGWAERFVRMYALLGVGALLFACGPFSPLHGWAYAFLPFAEKARSPAHAIYVFQLAAIVLAAYGLDRFLERREEDAGYWRAAKRTLVVFALGSAALVYSRTPMGEMEAEPGDAILFAALLALLLAAVIEGFRRGALGVGGARAALMALLVCELYSGMSMTLVDKDDPKHNAMTVKRYEQYDGVMGFLKSQPQPFRFELIPQDGLDVNIGAWHGLEQINGFLASVDKSLYDFFGDVGWVEGRLMMNTVYTVARERQRDVQQLVYEDPVTEWNVYRNPDANPRAWIIHSPEGIAGADHQAPVENCEGSGERASVEDWSAAHVEVEYETACPGYLVLGSAYFRGWKIADESESLTLYRGVLPAVAVSSGGGTVRFEYHSAAIRWGLWLSALGFMLCLGSAFFIRRRR